MRRRSDVASRSFIRDYGVVGGAQVLVRALDGNVVNIVNHKDEDG